jgi:LytS/YehU family sensor histidine kinase
MEPMLMLPLVENALKHGDLDLNPNGYLHILLRLDNKRLFLQVENTFDPENLQKDDIGGVGLTNIRKRLKLKYGPRHSFETEITNRVFTARLSVPSKTL